MKITRSSNSNYSTDRLIWRSSQSFLTEYLYTEDMDLEANHQVTDVVGYGYNAVVTID